MKIDLSFTLKTLSGDEIKDSLGQGLTAGRCAANVLVSAPKGGIEAIKAYELASKFYNNSEIDLDSTDLEKLKKAIELAEDLSVLAKAQILLALKAE